jgi:signal peptidase I
MNNRNELSPAAQKTPRIPALIREYTQSIGVAVLLALLIRTFLIQSFIIPSGSMEDTLLIGDRLLVNKFIYGTKIPFTDRSILSLRDPQRGDVIVFEYPKDTEKDFIKRVIGTPGDVITIRDKRVFINNVLYANPHEIHKDQAILPNDLTLRDNFGPITVPNDAYFVMGDNRDNSYDSRFWGFVKKDKIKGLAIIKFWSWDSNRLRVRWENIGRLISWNAGIPQSSLSSALDNGS